MNTLIESLKVEDGKICDFIDCEQYKKLPCSTYNEEIFQKPDCYRPLTTKEAEEQKASESDLKPRLFKVERTETDTHRGVAWHVINKDQGWRICEAYSKRDAYDIARALNRTSPNK